MVRQPSRNRRSIPTTTQRVLRWLRGAISGTVRLFLPGARGVYPPHPDSLIVLGIALPADADIDDLSGRLWWRGLGIVERNRHVIAGADITAAVQNRRVRQARQFVIKQLRDAGIRGAVTRWEHPVFGDRKQAPADKGQAALSRAQRAKQRTDAAGSTASRAGRERSRTTRKRHDPPPDR